eukprot:352235-Chlamydomonas_euryale.AAC.4
MVPGLATTAPRRQPGRHGGHVSITAGRASDSAVAPEALRGAAPRRAASGTCVRDGRWLCRGIKFGRKDEHRLSTERKRGAIRADAPCAAACTHACTHTQGKAHIWIMAPHLQG